VALTGNLNYKYNEICIKTTYMLTGYDFCMAGKLNTIYYA
jgi:hypothetical protein